jgi:hypothetical protein
MERIGTLETVCRYPVKSMAGEEIEEAFVGFSGLMGDRAFAFVREPGPSCRSACNVDPLRRGSRGLPALVLERVVGG